MPDLSNKGAHQFWHEYPDPIIYQVIALMESVENWTTEDNPELEKALTELGVTLDNIGNIDLQDEEAKFIHLLSCLKIGRSLQVLHAIDSAQPGAASKMFMYAEKIAKHDPTATIFLRRNMVFERLRLLSRIFSETRLATILKILTNKESHA